MTKSILLLALCICASGEYRRLSTKVEGKSQKPKQPCLGIGLRRAKSGL